MNLLSGGMLLGMTRALGVSVAQLGQILGSRSVISLSSLATMRAEAGTESGHTRSSSHPMIGLPRGARRRAA